MYKYEEQRQWVFTESGQVQFLAIRDKVGNLLKLAGAVSMERAISGQSGGSWEMMACVDRLVELGEIYELTPTDSVPGQYRVFVKKGQ